MSIRPGGTGPMIALTLTALLAGVAGAAGLPEALATETQRGRVALDAIPSSSLVDGERPRLRGALNDVDAYLKVGRIGLAIESLSSAAPGVTALARVGAGWDDSGRGAGKHIDDLVREHDDVGRYLGTNRPRFPAKRGAGQSAFVRGLAEQSFGQVDEYYAVAVDYGKVSGVSAGAYYLGRAEGQMAFALFLAQLESRAKTKPLSLASLAPAVDAVENEIITAYAKPGSTAQHSNFILANSSLKLARELENHGFRFGSLLTLLRSLFALTLATLPPPADASATLAAKAEAFEKKFAASTHDDSIGEAFVEKARLALEKSATGGEAAERETLRAAALLNVVIPRYLEITESYAR
jgi:hypothetical protein